MQRVVKLVLMIIVAFTAIVMVGCDAKIESLESVATIENSELKGDSKNCAVVLRAEQGKTYNITIQTVDGGGWARFSNGMTYIEGEMETDTQIVFIYFTKNETGSERELNVWVEFSDSTVCSLFVTQQSFDANEALKHDWPEMPLCDVSTGYIYNTHYGKLGVKSNARNYSYCFDPKVRASLWVAYPLHSAYTTGSGNRNYSSFGYDPEVSTSVQANMRAGSYNGWYDRGHQIPAADRKCSQEMMDQTFYATNMTPQQANFNQNKWGYLEGRVRGMICSDTLYVVTGAYFDGLHHSSIDGQTTDKSGNICPTPTYYYKALLRTKKGNTGKKIHEIKSADELRAIAFWMEHENSGEDVTISSADCISIEELETLTGFTFFPMIDDAIEADVKRSVIPSEWGIY